ncbi:MAG: c-type cytochrome [Fluviicola sp.]|nr:c-type cytochrome [Fluviicola sp.]
MKIIILSLVTITALFFTSCGGEKSIESQQAEDTIKENVDEVIPEKTSETSDEMTNKGIGPISSIELGEIDDALAMTGRELFKINCTACHKFGKRYIGPALAGLTDRRSPEWIMNMILNPDVMVVEDPIAKALLEEYSSPMANQQLTEDEARAIFEFIRTRN